jgi:hypothetical protein
MDFRIADSFTAALARLSRDEQKAVKTSAFDLQTNPTLQGLQLHRVDASKDPNFWSCRVNRDIRIIIHKTAQSLLLAYVDHHDDAYKWAERRRIEAHPKTGAIQIVEVRERVEEIAYRKPQQMPLDLGDAIIQLPIAPKPATAQRLPFTRLSTDDLLSVGVPGDWLDDILKASEDGFLDLAAHLPSEAGEALLDYAATGILKKPAPVIVTDPFAHPDALRRFRVVENVEELALALELPWEKWTVFLHPSQRAMVTRSYSGPARVAGSAGTGKTVVAVHRAAQLAARGDRVRVLLTTFSEPLAAALERKVKILAGDAGAVVPRISVAPFIGIARDLYQLTHGRNPQMAGEDLIKSLLLKAAAAEPGPPINERFLLSEWQHVVDAWQLKTAEGYAEVPRLGRKNRMGKKQRDRIWPVFERVIKDLDARGFLTEAGVFQSMAAHYEQEAAKPFEHIVVDEAQDLGVPELRFLIAIAPPGADALFFAGDLGQRIFQQPFSWKALGVSVQGRSQTLKVNYRTSHQIRETADRLLPGSVSDVDGNAEERRGTVSVFNGPNPVVVIATDAAAEVSAVAKFVSAALADGVQPDEIGIFVRTRDVLGRARDAVIAAGREATEITLHKDGAPGNVRIGVMHLAKGLEFKAVAVMGCDNDLLPLKSRIEAVADETELDDVFETERQLFYVACTRARDRLMVSGVKPGSEFIGDLNK